MIISNCRVHEAIDIQLDVRHEDAFESTVQTFDKVLGRPCQEKCT